MKIKFIRRFAIWQAVVFLIFAVSSCNKDRLVGLGVQPEGSFDGLQLADSLQALTTTRVSGPVESDQNQNYLGRINSTEFGLTIASIAVSFNLPEENLIDNVLDRYTLDSAFLNLRPTSVFGDYKVGSLVEIYKITAALDQDAYESDFIPEYDPQPVGFFTLSQDSIEFSRMLSDSDPFIYSISLQSQTAKEISDWYKDQGAGNETFHGFYLRTRNDAIAGSGSLFQFTLQTNESNIRLFYTDTLDTTIVPKTIPIGSNGKRVSMYSNNHAGSDAEDAINSASLSQQKIYVQGLGGTKGVIKIPALSDLANGRDLAISKASMVIKVDPDQTEELRSYSRLILLDDDPNAETLTLDFLTSSTRAGGLYKEDLGGYEFDITRTVQKIVDESNEGRDVNYGFTLNAEVPLLNGNNWNQIVLLGSENVIVNVYYTDITD